jgi:hypothetical protein
MAPPHLPPSPDRRRAGLTRPHPFEKGRGACSILASEAVVMVPKSLSRGDGLVAG